MQADDEVRKILGQLQQQARDTTRNLAKTRAELASKEREGKQTALTIREIEGLPKSGDVKVYRGVGKMFMQETRASIDASLKSKEKAAKQEVVQLTNRQKYLEGEIESNQRALREVLRGLEQRGMS